MSATATQVWSLAWRALRRTLRQPGYILPPLLFPLGLLAVNSAGLSAETRLPGFPAPAFLDFALAVPFVQGALFATMNAGTELARDIQTGFLNRLALTPMRGSALLAGQLAAVVAMGLMQALVYLLVGLAAGVHVVTGVGGALLVLALGGLVALAFGAVGTLMALRTGSGEAVQGLFPLLFVFLFLSSMNIPRHLMVHTWFRDLATANPVSYFLEAIRSLVYGGWNGEALGLGFGLALLASAVGLVAAAAALRTRLQRT